MKRFLKSVFVLFSIIFVVSSCTTFGKEKINNSNMNYYFINYYSFLFLSAKAKHIKIVSNKKTNNGFCTTQEMFLDKENRISKITIYSDPSEKTTVDYKYDYSKIERIIYGEKKNVTTYNRINEKEMEFNEKENGILVMYGVYKRNDMNVMRSIIYEEKTKTPIMIADYIFKENVWTSFNEIDANKSDSIMFEHKNIYDKKGIIGINVTSEKYGNNSIGFKYNIENKIERIEYKNENGVNQEIENIEYL